MRIVITGHPKTGKTTLAKSINCEHTRGTDELIDTHDWSEQSETASHWFDCEDPFVIEGCAIPRALRKWRGRNPGKPPPFDIFIYMTSKFPGPMGKGIDTVMDGLWLWLKESNVIILKGAGVK